MKKIITLTCILSFAATTSLYAQSKKQIIANQQTQIQQQQKQIDSLRSATANIQNDLNQISGQLNNLDSTNKDLILQNQKLQHQIDSVSSVNEDLKQTVKLKEEAEQKSQQELTKYRTQCAGSEKKLQDTVNKDPYRVIRFSETKTALLQAYGEKCQAGHINTLEQVKWSFQKNEEPSNAKGFNSPLLHQYTFTIECPNKKEHKAYEFCFMTIIDPRPSRIFATYTPCPEQA